MLKSKNESIEAIQTIEISWAPSNPWFKLGFDHHIIQELNDVKIKIMSVPYFLASKFTAFEDRGRDPRTSHDFEDIVYILDNRISLVNDILDSDLEVKKFLIARFSNLLKDESLVEAILAHLEPETQSQRFEILKQKLSIITS